MPATGRVFHTTASPEGGPLKTPEIRPAKTKRNDYGDKPARTQSFERNSILMRRALTILAFVAALDKFNVPAAEKNELLSALASMKGDIVER
jgi:hypothetical protein